MGHNCGSTCKRKTGGVCSTCRRGGGKADAPKRGRGRPSGSYSVEPSVMGAAVDMYFDGLSYRQVAQNIEDYFDEPTDAATIYRWVQASGKRGREATAGLPVKTGDEWVADELAVNVGGRQYWLFNVMDSESRYLLAAYLSPTRGARAAATAMSIARDRADRPPKTIKTDGLRSYREGVGRAFMQHQVKHVVSQGIRAEINNNLSERLQGTLRDRDKTLRAMKTRDTGQNFIDGLAFHYNYLRPHESLRGRRPAEAAGADIPFKTWGEMMEQTHELPRN